MTAETQSVDTSAATAEPTVGPYAIIATGGRQYRVTTGQKLVVNKLEAAPGDLLELKEVLFVNQGGKALVGAPFVDGAIVTVKVVGSAYDKKVRVFKKKRRTGYTKRQGHRQERTQVTVERITAP